MVRSVKGADVSALQAKKLVHAKQIEHFRGMLARQMTTKIWIEPKQAYLEKLKEHASLANELHNLTGKAVPKYQTDVIPITFSMVVKNLKTAS